MEPQAPSVPELSQVKNIEDVRARGRENIYKSLDKAIDFVAPLADAEGLYKLGKNRVENATVEILNEISDSIQDSVDRVVVQPWNKTKEFAKRQTESFVHFSAVLGFKGGGKIEAAAQKMSHIIDEVREFSAIQKEKRVVAQEQKLEKYKKSAREARSTVSETRKTTAKMTTIRDMAASL